MTEKIYQTDRGWIYYWINEFETDRLTLVFLPGLTTSHRLFEKQLELFEHQYNVFVWDAPGHGASRPFELSFSLDDKAGYLHEIFAIENISKPVVIGQSMGGYMAQCYLDNFPDSLMGMILIDSASLKRKYMTSTEIWSLKNTEYIYRAFPWEVVVQIVSKGNAETRYGQKLMQDMMREYTKDEYCMLASYGFRILAEAIEKNRRYDVNCPCLLLCGEDDSAGFIRRYNRTWSRREKLPLIWIKNAGHNANTDAPERVNEIIQRFIEQVE